MTQITEYNVPMPETGSDRAVWVPTTTIRYQSFDEDLQAVRSSTPDNAKLIAMAKSLKPDLSWYPTQTPNP